jgi:uncharacterized protein
MQYVHSEDGIGIQPVGRDERIVTLDVLRGLALLGVIVANMLFFSGVTFRFPAYRAELQILSLDSIVYHGTSLLVRGKAIATLSFLFGLGFAIQMLRAHAQGVSATHLYVRRLTVLLMVGLLHAVFLWYGDILSLYATLGFVLILFVNRSDRTVLLWAASLVVLLPIALGVAATVQNLTSAGAAAPMGPSRAEVNAATLAVFQSGSYSQMIRENIVQALQFFRGIQGLLQLQYLGLFLLGLYVGRHRIFEQVGRYEPVLRQVAAWGLAIGFAGGIVDIIITVTVGRRSALARADLALLMYVLTVTTMVHAAGYVALVGLLLRWPFWQRCLSAFAPAGRMALTNYLTQTVVCLTIFYGGGLIGRTGPAFGVLIALMIYAAQMAWSAAWLSRFRMGPAEWLWRSATYGRLQPLSRGAQTPYRPAAHA